MDSEDELSCKSSNYTDLYKYNGIFDNQNDRRNEKLEELKKRRNDAVDELRNITDILYNGRKVEVQTEAIPYRRKMKKNFSVRIMLSEWMVDVPVDLEESWYYKVCPKGIRNLIVASGGITRAYNKRNQIKSVFYSALPGGGAESEGAANNRITLLDCIFRNQDSTFYVLDILAWNSMSLINCSAEFRFYFIESKLDEDPRFSGDQKKFKAIPHRYATRGNISDTFSDAYRIDEIELPVDGILFYHKDSIYTRGLTPLVGWLKAYMLPERLDIIVNDLYHLQKPKSYTNFEDCMKRKARNKQGNSETSGDMDTIEQDDGEACEMEG